MASTSIGSKFGYTWTRGRAICFALIVCAIIAAIGHQRDEAVRAAQQTKDVQVFRADIAAGKLDTPAAFQARCGKPAYVRRSKDAITLFYSGSDQRIVSAVFIPKAHVMLTATELGPDGRASMGFPDAAYVYSDLSCKPGQ